MSIQLKLRRGTTAQHSTFTGPSGEVTVDTDKKTLVVHDGTTPGGNPQAKDSTVVHLAGTETVTGNKTFSGSNTHSGSNTFSGANTFTTAPTFSAGVNMSATGWSVVETAGVLFFQYNGVNKAKLDSSGNLTVAGNVTAYGTV